MMCEFVAESNRIEGITRAPTDDELTAMDKFLQLETVTVGHLEGFVGVYQPGARLRERVGMNVRVGDHVAPPGGPEVVDRLNRILYLANAGEHPYSVHLFYETLHPFMDGNGRSGRALWAWQMVKQNVWPGLRLGFLHAFYYQALSHSRVGTGMDRSGDTRPE